jgi:HD-GYP domain-containing protein (c-di-GMP phosphodiesterase class II)
MSTNDYEDDDFDLEDNSSNTNNDLVKQLRKANKQKEKELSELQAKMGELSKAQRERAIKDVLEARGVNKKIASFIPQDLDPTEESLSKWLDDNGDVFGLNTESNQNNVDPAAAAAYQKMNQTVNQGLTPDSNDDIMKRLLSAETPEQLQEVMRQSGL